MLIYSIIGCAIIAFAFLLVALNRDAKEAMRRAADAPVRPFADINPSRIRLVPRETLEWADEKGALEQAGQLHALGFRDAGFYEIEAKEDYRIWGFVRPEGSIRAVVREMPEDGQSVNVVTRYQDGGMLTLSNSAKGIPVSRPPGLDLEYLPGFDAQELVGRMHAERTDRAVLKIGVEGFAAEFEEVWAILMDWQNLRGGLDEDELRAVGRSRGLEWDDHKIAELREEQETNALAGLYESLAHRYFAEADLTVSQRYRLKSLLVIIHDRMPIEAIAGAFRLSLEEADSRIARASRSASLHDDTVDGIYPKPLTEWSPRQAFASLNETFPRRRRYGKLAELTEPIAADVYAPPGARMLPRSS
jgi:hypothetical protein